VVRPSRREYYALLADVLPAEALVVTSLGNASYVWAQLRDRGENFYVEDAMGLALPVALGLAIAQPARRVVVSEGDGGLLMHLGALVTVGAVAPPNLTVLVVQNGVHAASGGQPLTSASVDLVALARSVGIARAERVETPERLASAIADALAATGPTVLGLVTAPDPDGVAPPEPFVPVVVKDRFQRAIGAPRYVPLDFGGGRLVSGPPVSPS
jgi:thiamine pyrophosphate-dependent acetolactate synthase large subunit-like protein